MAVSAATLSTAKPPCFVQPYFQGPIPGDKTSRLKSSILATAEHRIWRTRNT